jgi:ribose/xylose/arabinose/galactoside ABC-type transport system permease subunit
VLKGKLLGIPYEFVAFLMSVAVAQFILSLTSFGRHIYLFGDSPRAAEAVGMPTWRTVTFVYFWAGLFAAVSGILLALRYGESSMEYGAGYDYSAIAAVLVGGTAVQGGQGAVWRTFLGVIVIAVVQMILLLNGMRQEWQYFIAGLIVLVVIMLQTRLSRGVNVNSHWAAFPVSAITGAYARGGQRSGIVNRDYGGDFEVPCEAR